MGAARWVVIGTALVAAATAFHLLMSPAGRPRPVSFPQGEGPQGEGPRGDRPNGAVANGAATNAPPEEQIDAESREAMRDFLRQAEQGEE